MPGIHLHMHLQLFFTADYHPALAQSLPSLPGHTHPLFTCRHPPPLCLFPHWSPVFLTTGSNTPEVLRGFWAIRAQREGVLCLWVSPVLFYFKQKALMLDLLSWEWLPLTLDKQELTRLNWRINANTPGSAKVSPQRHHRWPGYGPLPLQLFTVIITAQAPMLPSHKWEHQCTRYLK